MEAPLSTGIAQAPGEYDYGGEMQGATQDASQTFYRNDVHPMDRPFFGCLQPCNSALRRIDFVKTRPIVRIGHGPNNDFNVSWHADQCETLPPSLSLSLSLHPFLTSHVCFFLIYRSLPLSDKVGWMRG